MSHTATIKSVAPRSISAVRRALLELDPTGKLIWLEEKAKPRMYYADQMQKHLKRKNEIADYVIRVKDAFYDIALLRQDDGTYSIHFDDYVSASMHSPPDMKGIKKLSQVLGIPHKGPVEHWSGEQVDKEQATHSIAKFLQSYSKHAALEIAEAQGMMLQSCTVDDEGNQVLTFCR